MKSKLSNENEVRMIVDARPGPSLDLQNKHFGQAASFLASGLSLGLLRRSHVDLIIIILVVVVVLLPRRLDFHLVVNDNVNMNVNQVLRMFWYWRRPVPFIVNNQPMNPIPIFNFKSNSDGGLKTLRVTQHVTAYRR